MLDTCVDSLATFSDILNFQMYACENSRENKLLKIAEDFLSFLPFVHLQQTVFTKYIY